MPNNTGATRAAIPYIQQFLADGEVRSNAEIVEHVSKEMERDKLHWTPSLISSALRLMDYDKTCQRVGWGRYKNAQEPAQVVRLKDIREKTANWMRDVEDKMVKELPNLPEGSAAKEELGNAIASLAQARESLQAQLPQAPIQAFGPEHCVDGGGLIGIKGGYEGRVLVLDMEALCEDSRTPENQLYWCDFRVYEQLVGTFVSDPTQQEGFLYTDFIGVLDEQYLPDWAKEPVDNLRQSYQERNMAEDSLTQTMQ